MSLLVFGLNHKSAPLALRERAAIVPESLRSALQSLAAHCDAETAILSTCNRTELYLYSENPVGPKQVETWLSDFRHLEASELCDNTYALENDDALRHMIGVSAGLDSLVLGEPQILGQMKSAWSVATESGTLGAGRFQEGGLAPIFAHVFSVAKKVRTHTAIGENPVSVAYAAVSLTQHIFENLAKQGALLIGAGDTIELVAQHLKEKGIGRITIANRTFERASALAENYGAHPILLGDIGEHLAKADIVVSSTASQLPVLGKGAVEKALKERKHKPMLMVDIAVPRDIEPQVADLKDVYLYSVDDLKTIVDDNRKQRAEEAEKALEIVEQGIADWRQQSHGRHNVGLVKQYRARAEALRDAELEKALRQIERGDEPEAALEALARSLTRKLIHDPTIGLRDIASSDDPEKLDWSKQLLNLDNT